jgi:hypothetical protein
MTQGEQQELLPSVEAFYTRPLRIIVGDMLDILGEVPHPELKRLLPQYAEKLLAAGKTIKSEPHKIFGCSLMAASTQLRFDANTLLNPDIVPWRSLWKYPGDEVKRLDGDLLGVWLAMRQHLTKHWDENFALDSNASLSLHPFPGVPALLEPPQVTLFAEALQKNDCNVFSALSIAIVGGKTGTGFTEFDRNIPEWRKIFGRLKLFNDRDGYLTFSDASVLENKGQFDFVISSDVYTYPYVNRANITLMMDNLLKDEGHHVHIMSINPKLFSSKDADHFFGLENTVFMQECIDRGREEERAMIFSKLPDLKRIALQEGKNQHPYRPH